VVRAAPRGVGDFSGFGPVDRAATGSRLDLFTPSGLKFLKLGFEVLVTPPHHCRLNHRRVRVCGSPATGGG
jgi:hypothetical protein